MNERALREAIAEYQTPFYIFDTDALSEQVKRIRDALGGRGEICYAMKANPFIIAELLDKVDSFEVCSPGEFHICERAGIPMEKIVMSGVYKNPRDIEYAVKKYGQKGIYTAESYTQWEILRDCAQEFGAALNVLLRLGVGSQFGMDESDTRRIVSEREKTGCLHIEGIQLFSGTQKKAAGKYKREFSMLTDFIEELEREYGFHPSRLEYGPGLPICYFDEEENAEDRMLFALTEQLEALKFDGKIVLEMGRFIAASCGSYVTSVVDTKCSKGQSYCIVDGGIHHMNYYGQMMAMKKPPVIHWKMNGGAVKKENRWKERRAETADQAAKWTVCGSLCTMNDILVKQYPFEGLSQGDRLIFERVGAYSVTEGIALLLSRPLPQVFLYSERDGFRFVRGTVATDTLNWFQEEAVADTLNWFQEEAVADTLNGVSKATPRRGSNTASGCGYAERDSEVSDNR